MVLLCALEPSKVSFELLLLVSLLFRKPYEASFVGLKLRQKGGYGWKKEWEGRRSISAPRLHAERALGSACPLNIRGVPWAR